MTVIALGACKGGASRQAPTPAVTKASVLIRNVRVFDGARVVASTGVAIDGGTIVVVRPGLVVPPEMVIVPGEGRTPFELVIDDVALE